MQLSPVYNCIIGSLGIVCEADIACQVSYNSATNVNSTNEQARRYPCDWSFIQPSQVDKLALNTSVTATTAVLS